VEPVLCESHACPPEGMHLVPALHHGVHLLVLREMQLQHLTRCHDQHASQSQLDAGLRRSLHVCLRWTRYGVVWATCGSVARRTTCCRMLTVHRTYVLCLPASGLHKRVRHAVYSSNTAGGESVHGCTVNRSMRAMRAEAVSLRPQSVFHLAI
jgi:hypothetical protein